MKHMLGYADRLTVRPEEEIGFQVSCREAGSFTA